MKKPLLVILLSLNAAISDAAVYQQLPGHFGGLGSDSISVSADDFQFAQATPIGSIAWWGGSYTPSPMDDPDAFSVRLFSDSNGQPGMLLSDFMIGSISKMPTGDFLDYYSSDQPDDEYPEYRYTVSLQQTFVMQSGVRYWLSIANPPANMWLWEASASDLNPGSMRSFYEGSWQADEYNVAFELEAAPEPQTGTLVAIGIAVACILGLTNRCRQRGMAPSVPLRGSRPLVPRA